MAVRRPCRPLPTDASALAEPSRVTLVPVVTFCAGPAFATGATLRIEAVMVTVAAALFTLPSLTMRLAV